MGWDPAHYDNITVMRVLYADIWNPGKNVNVNSVISNKENSFSNFDLNLANYSSYLIDNDINFSDHKPLKILISWSSNCLNNLNSNSLDLNGYKNLISIAPNFNNDEIKAKYNSILINNINFYMNQSIDDINNNQNIIDNMYSQLTTSIVNAFKSCSRTVSVNSMKKQKNWFTSELNNLKKKMLILRFKDQKSEIDIIELRSLKYKFKKIMKNNINLYEKNYEKQY